MQKTAVVVTSINSPNAALEKIAQIAGREGAEFLVIGDTKSPADFHLDGCEFFDIDRQKGLDSKFAQLCPTKHYARKNIGYIIAAQRGADRIYETDDDNIPYGPEVLQRQRTSSGHVVNEPGWCNVYRYYSGDKIWPRGLPLDKIDVSPPAEVQAKSFDCPIHQGLANENPDVDAIYRLLLPLPLNFRDRADVILANDVWCPFNSQNTTFWRDAFLLMYLPYHCSFRMTDIWRSFVAQRIMWECDWNLLFHSATVYQERNEHDLMIDFRDEVPGYLNNEKIKNTLAGLSLSAGASALGKNLIRCYEALVDIDVVGREELPLVRAWVDDIERATG